MSELEEGVPLTRRELRRRQRAELESTSESEELAQVSEPSGDAPIATESSIDDEIHIDPYDENGVLRTRREMRELREAARAELLREREERERDEPVEAEPTPVVDPETTDVKDEDVKDDEESLTSPDAGPAEASTRPEDDHSTTQFDSRLAATQAFSLEDLKELQGDSEQAEQDRETEPASEAPVVIEDEEVPEPKRAGLFSRFRKGSSLIENDTVPSEADSGAEPEVIVPESETPANEEGSETLQTDQLEDLFETDDKTDEGEEGAYSFPDIAPLEESRSVFDDPTVQTIQNVQDEQPGVDFEDMISRAVTDEGSGRTSGSASLILPSLPESDDLTGPLGETGELYITGSLELPKSLGETGGHTRGGSESDLLADPDEFQEYSTDPGSSPISASSAVSSRFSSGSGLVTPETKKDSKKTIILASAGGLLIIAIIAGAVWMWNAGLFG